MFRALTCLGVACLGLGACDADAPVGHMAGPPCPERMVHLADVGACIDRYESALDGPEGAARSVPAEGRLPVNEIDWFGARRACASAGLRLCTAAEWQRACTGSTDAESGRAFPYGAEFEAGRCNSLADGVPSGEPAVAPGGSFEGCVTDEGVYDLSGNVDEWVSDTDLSGHTRELRGGSYGSFERYAHCVTDPLMYQPPDSAVAGRGFRCCRDAAGH